MAPTSFAMIQEPGLTVSATRHGDALRVVIVGTVEARDPGALLDPYWSELDQTVRREGIGQVELDVSGLDFMNSAGLLTLVRWVMKVRAEPGYQLVLRHDENVTWQKTNVPVLAKLAPSVVRLAAT
jgi:ABC-type transporter Mla MlaB component